MTAIFEDVLRALLISSNLVGNRVYLMRAPQNPSSPLIVPYIVFTPTGPEPMHFHSGPSGLLNRNYQTSIFDESQSRALAVADSLRAFLDGYTGDYGGVRFGSILFRLQTVQYETDTRIFQVIPEYRIRFRLLDSFPAVHTKKGD